MPTLKPSPPSSRDELPLDALNRDAFARLSHVATPPGSVPHTAALARRMPDDFRQWLWSEIAARFPSATLPPPEDAEALWQEAKGDRELIIDVLDYAWDRDRRKPNLRPAQWAAAVLRKEDSADLHRRAEQVRRRREAAGLPATPPTRDDEDTTRGAEALGRLRVLRAAVAAYECGELRDHTLLQVLIWMVKPTVSSAEVADAPYLADVMAFVRRLPLDLRRLVPFLPPPEFTEHLQAALDERLGERSPHLLDRTIVQLWALTRDDPQVLDDLLTLAAQEEDPARSVADYAVLTRKEIHERARRTRQRGGHAAKQARAASAPRHVPGPSEAER